MIDEKKLIEDIEKEFDGVCVYDVSPSQAVNDFVEIVDRQPKIGEWIPCSERFPEELTPVNVTWANRKPTIYYENIKDIPFTATAVYCNEKWFWWSSICEDILAEYGRNDAEMVDEEVEIIAWMPLPEPYKENEDE